MGTSMTQQQVTLSYQTSTDERVKSEHASLLDAMREAWRQMVQDSNEQHRIGIVRITDVDGATYDDDEVAGWLLVHDPHAAVRTEQAIISDATDARLRQVIVRVVDDLKRRLMERLGSDGTPNGR